ncbi:histidine kinase [Chloroflexota bacterium]
MLQSRLRSLRERTVLFVAGILILCGFLSVFIISELVSAQMETRYRAEIETSIEYLSMTLVPMIELQDYPRVERTIESVLVYPYIVAVAVYDADGELIRSVTKLDDEAIATDSISHVLRQDEDTIGRVNIGFSHAYTDDEVRRLTRVLALAVSGFLAVTAAGLLWYLGRTVTRPLRSIAGTVKTLSAEDLSARVQVTSNDEIGSLANTFNTMADDLQESQKELREAHAQLEERYRARAERDERRAEQLRRIFALRQQMNSIPNAIDLLGYVAIELQKAFQYYSVNVFVVDQMSGDLTLAAGTGGYHGDAPIGRVFPIEDGIVGLVVRTCQPLLVSDVAANPDYFEVPELKGTKTEVAVPINIGALTLGVLDIQGDKEKSLDEMDLYTAQAIADQLANALENERLSEETRELAILEERNRMAREIHDTLAQGFTGIVLQLEAAEQGLSEAPESVPSHINRARALARESLSEARRSVWALRPQALEKRDLAGAIRREVERVAGEGRVGARFVVSGKRARLEEGIEDALLRITQEALTNIRRHSGASTAEVRLAFGEETVRLSVVDNGAGFDTSSVRAGSFGLIGMGERAQACGGNTRVTSTPGNGTKIEVTVPSKRRHDVQDTDTSGG